MGNRLTDLRAPLDAPHQGYESRQSLLVTQAVRSSLKSKSGNGKYTSQIRSRYRSTREAKSNNRPTILRVRLFFQKGITWGMRICRLGCRGYLLTTT